ncbi:hypothetical protein D3C81_1259680 [compost metagenome]
MTQLRTVQATRVLHQFGTRPCSFEITPQYVRITLLQFHEELALGRCIIHRRTVIAIHRVIQIRINAAQQVFRILAGEIREQILERAFTRIRRSRQQVFALDLPFQVKGGTTIDIDFVVVMIAVITCHQFDRTRYLVLADGEIAQCQVEPVIGRDVEVTAEAVGATICFGHRDFD